MPTNALAAHKSCKNVSPLYRSIEHEYTICPAFSRPCLRSALWPACFARKLRGTWPRGVGSVPMIAATTVMTKYFYQRPAIPRASDVCISSRVEKQGRDSSLFGSRGTSATSIAIILSVHDHEQGQGCSHRAATEYTHLNVAFDLPHALFSLGGDASVLRNDRTVASRRRRNYVRDAIRK